MSKKKKVLFILKYRYSYDDTEFFTHAPQTVLSSGLCNSASFVHEMLLKNGIESKLVHVIDNNGIDREVAEFKPDIVIIEAIWVVPEKFEILKKLHPSVTWIVRVHSEIPFLAGEGSAMGWIKEYMKTDKVFVAPNSPETYEDFITIANAIGPDAKNHVTYLPNYYPVGKSSNKNYKPYKGNAAFNVGCFGAVRPMKNQLIQAIAAISYAQKYNVPLRFHINATRQDNKQTLPVLKNIRSLFEGLDEKKFKLVEHPWYERDEFLEVLRWMDIGLQVSFTESFNIITADYVSQGVPVVTSPEVRWVPDWFHADPTSSVDIVAAMERSIWFEKNFKWTNWVKRSLVQEVRENAKVWIKALK